MLKESIFSIIYTYQLMLFAMNNLKVSPSMRIYNTDVYCVAVWISSTFSESIKGYLLHPCTSLLQFKDPDYYRHIQCTPFE